jgi:hypothetical protein
MIDTVTVYRRGARVRRSIPIEPGATEVKLTRLPLALDDGSVRVQVEGNGVRAVDVRVGVEVPPEDPSLAPPRDEELRAAARDLAVLRAEVERIGKASARLDSLTVRGRPRPKRGEAPGAIPVDARQKLARLRSAEAERLSNELASRRTELRRAERKHAELQDRARRASSARNAREHELRKTALVRLDGRADGGAKLLFEYLVPGACWSPSYTVWLEDQGRARLAMRAVVAQRSGEDWKGAKLVLSTADPERWTELPELAKLRIGRAQPPRPKRAWRAPPEGAAALYADYDRVFGEPRGAEIPEAAPTSEVLEGERETPVEAIATARPAPPPGMMPQAAPVPVMARARSSTLLETAAGVIAAPAALLDAMIPKQAASYGRLGGGPAAPEPAEVTAAPTFDLDVEAMAYGRLRMFGPDSARRGELAAIAATEVYAEGLTVSIDVAVAIRVAVQVAELDAALPAGHVWPEAPDAFDYAYAAEVAADVPSDGAFHVVPLVSWDVPAKLRHVAVPREASDVFRLVEIECPDAALLDGPADVYEKKRGEYTYLLTGRVRPTAPGARLSLGLGVEQAIKIARNVTFTEESTGLLGGGLALVHDIAIDLKNNLARAAEIEVRERVPIKREDDDDVEVVVGAVDPAWKDWDQEDTLSGGHAWTLSLGAGAEKTLKARYTVRISAKHQLVGGNRRES